VRKRITPAIRVQMAMSGVPAASAPMRRPGSRRREPAGAPA